METYFPQVERDTLEARERVREDLHQLIADSEMLLKATAHDVSAHVIEARARVAAGLEIARENCEALSRRGIASAKAAARSADEKVREHPYKAIGLAGLVGFLVGFLYDRRR